MIRILLLVYSFTMLVKNTAQNAPWLFCLVFQLVSSGPNDDVILGGIFSEHFPRLARSGSVHTKDGNIDPCGEQNWQATADRLAMEFAVSEINHSWEILPEIQLGVNVKDSCSDLDHAINNTLDYEFIKTRFLDGLFQCAHEKNETKCCLDRDKDPLVAIIAGGYSHIVKAIGNLVGLFEVPVIGYSSTSPSLNKMNYFLRTVAPDTVSTRVMVELIHKLHWNIVLLLYVDNEFGHYAADCFRKAIRSVKTKICIAYDEKFSKPSGKGDIKRVVDGINKAKKSRVILFFGAIEDFVYFLKHSKKDLDPNKYVWISSELFVRSDLIRIPHTIKHILAIIPEESYPKNRFIDYLQSRADVNTTCLHVLRSNMNDPYTHRTAGNCWFERSKHIPHVLDAVYAVAMAIHNMLGCEAGKSCLGKLKTIQERSLLDYLKNLSFFNNFTNKTISFDSNGNPRSARYTVLKLEIGNSTYKETILGNWTCFANTTYCTGPTKILDIDADSFRSNCGQTCILGERKSVQEEYPDCCWSCRKCTGNKYTNTSGQLSCSECPDDRWPDANHTSCAEIEHDYLDILSAPGILILAWDCLGVAVILFVCGVFLKYRSSHIVRASSRQLSLLLLLGITMDFALLMALLAEPNVLTCTAVFIVSHVSNCLVTGTLFLKTNRIHRIFRKSAMTEHPRCLGNACQLFITMILVLIEVTLVVSVLVFRPENGDVRVMYIMQGDSKKAFLLCNFFGKSFQNDVFHVLIWSYDCGLIFICTYQAYLVRKVPENYNEARYITFTMVTVSMNIIVFVITTSGMEGKNLVLVYCIFQSLKASIALGCMFLPKVYVILFQPEKNVPHNPVKSKLGTFVEESTVKAKADDSISSGTSTQSSESEASTVVTASIATRGRPYRKVGVKFEQGLEGESEDKFDDLRSREQGISSGTGECSDRSADVVNS